MDVVIKIQCPCCDSAVDVKLHRGIVINRMAFLRSRLISDKEQVERLKKQKPAPGTAIRQAEIQRLLEEQILQHQSELSALEGIEFK